MKSGDRVVIAVGRDLCAWSGQIGTLVSYDQESARVNLGFCTPIMPLKWLKPEKPDELVTVGSSDLGDGGSGGAVAPPLGDFPTVSQNGSKSSDSLRQSSDSPGVNRWQRTYEYLSHGSWYFRYAWGEGRTVKKQRHIPGGNIQSVVALRNKSRVDAAIASGATPDQVLELIKTKLW